ncbi:hypothetical protein CPB83DRAFT_835400 [Crepidotus variabilis]|uniref:Uncharacterized protein n=1 Tax=Crepidotus variabilis TaxID=179855 RepID=A0A9P6EH70_9AGAR|nr:hypothetical protein CPB83DRAFT_835400 [Crepidotus variabilis]
MKLSKLLSNISHQPMIVSRASNRAFVGSNILLLFPPFMRPIVNKAISQVGKRTDKALNLLQPSIPQRRREKERKGQDYAGKPVSRVTYAVLGSFQRLTRVDMLSWLMDTAEGKEAEEWYLTSRVLTVNFAAIHTSSMVCPLSYTISLYPTILLDFTQALYDLASHREYVKPLREEVEEVTSREGWTKTALDQLPRMDSFLKESQRLRPMMISTFQEIYQPAADTNEQTLDVMLRAAIQDYIFSDGTVVPACTKMAVYLSNHKLFGPALRDGGFASLIHLLRWANSLPGCALDPFVGPSGLRTGLYNNERLNLV